MLKPTIRTRILDGIILRIDQWCRGDRPARQVSDKATRKLRFASRGGPLLGAALGIVIYRLVSSAWPVLNEPAVEAFVVEGGIALGAALIGVLNAKLGWYIHDEPNEPLAGAVQPADPFRPADNDD